MAEPVILPRRLILSGALIAGLMLALAVHMLMRGMGFDVGNLFRRDMPNTPISAAIGWWIIAGSGFLGGRTAARLMQSMASGQIPLHLRRLLIGIGVLLLAAAGLSAATPVPTTTSAGVLGGVSALVIGGLLAFCGAWSAVRRD